MSLYKLNKKRSKCLWLLFSFMVSVVSPKPGYSNSASSFDPFQLYPNGIIFDVSRNGDIVGKHTVGFWKLASGKIKVTSKLSLHIKVLGLSFYKYFYRSEAMWGKGQLLQLEAKQNDDGFISDVNVEKEGSSLIIEGPNGNHKGRLSLYPSNHWNSGVLKSRSIIDTLNGVVARVKIENQGLETIKAQGDMVIARKYVYSGDVEATAWYDEIGRWVKLRFPARSNSVIEYHCVVCGLKTKK